MKIFEPIESNNKKKENVDKITYERSIHQDIGHTQKKVL